MTDKVIEFPQPLDEDKDKAVGSYTFHFLGDIRPPLTVDNAYLIVTPTFAAVGNEGVIYHAAPWAVISSVGLTVV